VAGIGGFSGRESDMSVSWFADAVAPGQIRWVLITGPTLRGALAHDTRIGSATVMAAVKEAGAKTHVKNLYSVSGRARALRALG
jgi:hypothetical protein